MSRATNDVPIGDFLRLAELACPCCGAVQVNPVLASSLDQLRRDGFRFCIISAYRCPTVQHLAVGAEAEVPGHSSGDAADIRPEDDWQPLLAELDAHYPSLVVLPISHHLHLHQLGC